MKKLKIGVIGGASTFTPELISLLADNEDVLGDIEVRLMDIDRPRLEIVGRFSERILKRKERKTKIIYADTVEEAVDGVDFILLQLRQGGKEARIQDDLLGKKYKIPFVETISICGFAAFLRTYYEFEKISKIIRDKAPDAWVMNFTNPSGQLTETLYRLGIKKVVGVCNAWITMKKTISKITALEESRFFMNWKGLNHLTFIDAIYYKGKNILPDVLNKVCDNHPGFPAGVQLARELNVIPNGYLQYYYNRKKIVDKLQKQDKVRAQIVKEIDTDLLDIYKNANSIPKELKKRGGYRYSYVVVNILKGIYLDDASIHYAVVKNESTLSCLPFDSFVEVPVIAKKEGLYPIQTGRLPDFAKALVITMKDYERMGIEAAMKRDRKLFLKAMMMHPLIGCYSIAKPLLDDCLRINRQYIPEIE